MIKSITLFCLFMAIMVAAISQNDETVLNLIKDEGLEKSQVMDIAGWLTDVHGPRLTGSPGLDKASDWALKQLTDWGLSNVHLDEWGPFGRGWTLKEFEMHSLEPSYWPILAYPKAWSPSVEGESEVIYLDIKDRSEIDQYRGKLEGKFVLMDTIRNVDEPFEGLSNRHDAESLLKLANAGPPTPRPRRRNRSGTFQLSRDIWKMLEEEKPLAVLDRSYKGDYGTVFVSGARTGSGSARDQDKEVVPQMTLSVEHYNRIFRLMNRGIPVKLEVELESEYTNPDGMEHNIIAEIPGSDLAEEVVMFGAHIDSWHASTGATDNGAGSAVMMEVARILKSVVDQTGIQPRRSLRLALWTGEEQGLHGSRNYVGEHFAVFDSLGYTPQSLRPDQKNISAYYNLDNGTGKIRGVYLQGNEMVKPVFREWLDPFEELGASTLSLSNTGGTDHLPFDGVGIPAFQFIQEPMTYFRRTHHSSMDNFDHLVEEDLKQAATIIAYFVWQTAQRDEKLPRKPLDEDLK